MALIKCAECGKEISDSAENCPHCGCKTNQGKTVTKAKSLLVSFVITAAVAVIGVFLFSSALPELDVYSARYGSAYWIEGYWVYNERVMMELLKMGVGVAFVIGAIVGFYRIAKEAETLNKSEKTEEISKPEEEDQNL